MDTEELFETISREGGITPEQAQWAYTYHDRQQVYGLAHRVTEQYAARGFEFCAIANAKSGNCTEDCKWCAQSARNHAKCQTHGIISHDRALAQAKEAATHGVTRFSLVTSGKRLNNSEVGHLCATVTHIVQETGLKVCVSAGLLDDSAMRRLHEAGAVRYHCNLETAPSFFPHVCTSHTQEEKMRAISAALRAGMDICCGGIIGMGETTAQRIEFAYTLRSTGALSIPVNILHPIEGTPLENCPPLMPEEVFDFIAVLRLINPKATIRFAGGRASLTREQQLKAAYIGANAAIAGSLLTTAGPDIEEDEKMFHAHGADQ